MKAQKLKIIGETIAVLKTQISGNKTTEVEVAHKKEPTVEKNKSFHIFSQLLLHLRSSDNNGIVGEARKTGIKNNIIEENNIEIK